MQPLSRGHWSPLLLGYMLDQDKVRDLLERGLEEQDAFLIDFQIAPGNLIQVTADTLSGISLEKITAISRAIEHNLDREEEDFELQVSSPGVGSPLKVAQQYEQNLGRDLKVSTLDGEKYKGELAEFDGQAIVLQWNVREPKEVGKGKVTVKKEVRLDLSDIKEAKVQVRFN